MPIDKQYFHDLIKQSRYGSIRKLAGKMRNPFGRPMNISAASQLFIGKRRMQLDEARQLSELLEVPITEIIDRAGIAVALGSGEAIEAKTYLGKGHELHIYKDKRDTLPRPSPLVSDAQGIRVRAPQDPFDGWIFYLDRETAPTADGRLCLANPDTGRPRLGFVSRGYKRGTYNLLTLSGESAENLRITHVQNVLLIRP